MFPLCRPTLRYLLWWSSKDLFYGLKDLTCTKMAENIENITQIYSSIAVILLWPVLLSLWSGCIGGSNGMHERKDTVYSP